MNLTKFLLIDASLILLGVALLLLLKPSKAKAFLLEDFKGNEVANQTFRNLPVQQKLLELEKIAQKDGSGITPDSLIGLWKFTSVWKKGTEKEDLIASSLLRLFSASLEIEKDQSNQLAITNSIQFGLLSIRFTGTGKLKGKQPLLPFFFECIELKAGSVKVLSRSLKIPDEKDWPFFALISMEKNSTWLSARGRGGGLALWINSSKSDNEVN